jgi:hypothetical protein
MHEACVWWLGVRPERLFTACHGLCRQVRSSCCAAARRIVTWPCHVPSPAQPRAHVQQAAFSVLHTMWRVPCGNCRRGALMWVASGALWTSPTKLVHNIPAKALLRPTALAPPAPAHSAGECAACASMWRMRWTAVGGPVGSSRSEATHAATYLADCHRGWRCTSTTARARRFAAAKAAFLRGGGGDAKSALVVHFFRPAWKCRHVNAAEWLPP